MSSIYRSSYVIGCRIYFGDEELAAHNLCSGAIKSQRWPWENENFLFKACQEDVRLIHSVVMSCQSVVNVKLKMDCFVLFNKNSIINRQLGTFTIHV